MKHDPQLSLRNYLQLPRVNLFFPAIFYFVSSSIAPIVPPRGINTIIQLFFIAVIPSVRTNATIV